MYDCCIWNIYDLDNNKILVDLEINDKENIIENYDIELDLNKMGLKQEDEFVDELYKEIRGFINCFEKKNGRIPTKKEIKNEIESNNWLETKLWLEL